MSNDSNAAIIDSLINNIEKVIIGKRSVAELAVVALLCKGHVLIEDVPGVGKTSLVRALAKSVELSYRRIQFTPDIMPSDITGYSLYNPGSKKFEYHEGLLMKQIILADEINRASPKTQSSLLEAMEEHNITVDGVSHPLPEPFILMATQNPIDLHGIYPLPEAQLDRFMIKIKLGYPSKEEETDIISRFVQHNPLDELKSVVTASEIIRMQKELPEVSVHQDIKNYIVAITSATRYHKDVALGVSPRGTLMLMRAAQGVAYAAGRNYIHPDDVKRMIPYVLPHRIVLKKEAIIGNKSPGSIIASIASGISVPTFNS